MQNLNNLTKTLNSIEKISNKIIIQAVPILKEISKSDNELVEEIVQEVSNVDIEEINELLKKKSLGLVRDAKKVSKEIEYFSNAVVQGDDILAENEDQFKFLMKVWYGDMYENSGTFSQAVKWAATLSVTNPSRRDSFAQVRCRSPRAPGGKSDLVSCFRTHFSIWIQSGRLSL